jgi:hypothetical protein
MTSTSDLESLADRIIEMRSTGHVETLGQLYNFLVRVHGGDEQAGRVELLRYLRGELSPRVLRMATEEATQQSTPIEPLPQSPPYRPTDREPSGKGFQGPGPVA